MKKIILVLLLVSSIFFIPDISHASPTLSSCISGSGRGEIVGSDLVITVDLRVVCTVYDSKNPKVIATLSSLFPDSFPVYEIFEESFFINSVAGTCTGPSFYSVLASNGTSLGSATCRISSLISGRAGAVSSTFQMFSAYGGTVSIPVVHPAIPKRQSSSGTSSGSTGKSPIPLLPPSCTSAPLPPILTYTQDSNGITFAIAPAVGGQPVTKFAWSYSLWDVQKNNWDNWNEWQYIYTNSSFTERFEKQANKTRIVFSVEAGNDCGMTEQVRESTDHKGVSVGESALTQIITFPYFLPDVKLSVGTLTINAAATSALAVSYRSTNPGVCDYGNQLLHLYSSGTCTLVFSQPGNSEYKPAPDVQVHFEVLPSEPLSTDSKSPTANLLQQSIYVIPLKVAYKISEKSVLMRTGTDANLQVNVVSKNPKICNAFNEYQPTAFSVEIYKKGTCILTLTQSGNSLYKVAPKKLVTFKIT